MLASALISAGCVTAVWPTPQAVLAIGQVCSSSSSEAVLLGSVTATLRAAPAGMSIGVVFAAILLVVAVLSVIIYVLVTERKCVILFVNELDAAVTFKGAHFDHGDKDSLSYSESIPEAIVNPDLGVFPWAGFVIADRKKDFYGTQFGFSYKYGARSLSVGALCGLSNPGWLSKGNQCWCAIDNSAARVSEKLLDAKKLSHDAVKGNLKLTVNCNSHSGSPAFFIARAHSG